MFLLSVLNTFDEDMKNKESQTAGGIKAFSALCANKLYVISVPREPVPALVFVYAWIKCLQLSVATAAALHGSAFLGVVSRRADHSETVLEKTDGSDRGLITTQCFLCLLK